jgi:hypothetical protein
MLAIRQFNRLVVNAVAEIDSTGIEMDVTDRLCGAEPFADAFYRVPKETDTPLASTEGHGGLQVRRINTSMVAGRAWKKIEPNVEIPAPGMHKKVGKWQW